MKKNKWWIGLIVLQVLVLLGIAASYYAADHYGKDIVLKTKPVDPSDVFYGDYVTLNYEINEVSSSLWNGKSIEDPTPVYAVLSPDNDGLYRVTKVTGDRPDVKGQQVYLKGKATPSMEGFLHLEYGLERYYVKDNTGKQLESPHREYKVTVKVASWGKGVIQRIQPLN
ncbi:GDYXXLXY domain-containing protein [Fictibacillus sp. KIGAM418]|uniref:GDYXXLXY domain-containing protein n=1 Tax=Fictibacillus marinisediminis TaxID=2878389 RepID=A0A9X1X828_9BACL|nr:GDYXXLXY domain-containing protein [Fictibacillus marinisediminis]MCK6255847.1 GDYXXLXY domain-containing protein [Fictibacillus marinisediminis]